MAEALLKCLVIMRNVAMVSLVSLSICFAACSEDDASNAPNAPAAIATGADAGGTPDPMTSPLATTVAPPAPAPSAPAPSAPAPEEPTDAGAPIDLPAEDAGSDAGSDASAPIIIGVPVLFYGAIHVTEASGATCTFSIDGKVKGTSTVLDTELPIGTHDVTCHAADGREVTQSVTVNLNALTSTVLALPAPGTLVAVAVGGTCSFYVNGMSKGTTETLKMTIAAGTYSVVCYPVGGGAPKSRSVIIKPGETAMAMFKLS